MAAKGTAILTKGIRVRAVVYRLGQLFLPMAGLAGLPALVAFVFGELELGIRLLAMAGLLATVSLRLAHMEAPHDVRPNEAMAITALSFIIASLVMIWPMAAGGLSPLDAWFEAVSGVTTTGLTMIGDVESQSPGLQFTRAWLQWYGGLAIVVLALAVVLEPGPTAKRLADSETGLPDLVGGTRARARQALLVYGVLTAAGVVLLGVTGLGAWDALLHGMTAVSTGGFSTRNDSLAHFGDATRAVISLVSLSGAVAFGLYVLAWRRDWGHVWRAPELVGLLALIVLSSLLVILFMVWVGGQGWGEALRHGPVMAISAQTAAGFSSLDPASLDPASRLVLIGSMFVGGDGGSTAGGVKVLRLLIVFALLRHVLLRAALPRHAVASPMLAGQALEEARILAAMAVVVLHALVILVSWVVFVAHDSEPFAALFEVTSAVGTVGLSAGLTGPELAPSLKVVLIADMLMGRLEVIAILVLLYPANWRNRTGDTA